MSELQKSGASPCVPCHSDRAVQSTPAPECRGRRQPSPAPSDLAPCAGRETGGDMDKHIMCTVGDSMYNVQCTKQ